MILLIKILVTSGMVLTLSWISERTGPRAAGILAGFPLGIAVSLFFIGVEQSSAFAAASSVSTLGGLGASLVFCAAYWKASDTLKLNVVGSSALGFVAFLAAAAALGELPQNRWILTLVTLILTAIAVRVFRRIPAKPVGAIHHIGFGPKVLAVRAAVASVLVLVVTGLAGVVGEKWAGFLSGFPVTLYPVLLIAHISYSKEVAHSIIKGFPFGIGSLVVCALFSSFVLVPCGVYWGMLIAISAAGVYLGIVGFFMLKA